ncbi:Rv1733c family protein [Nocardia testacea]|uniref:Rv1733c family protein n=1 Tax=Nocardia testacea TaxID=248551 RepID=UPI0002F33218|nr:hypothetical protein [Nocardia testacea]
MIHPPSRYPPATTRLWNLRPWRDSPLPRPGDRLLAWLVCGALLVAAAAIPIAAAAGIHAHRGLSESAVEAAAERSRVPATLLDTAPTPNEYDLYPTVPATWFAAGAQHTGNVYAPAGHRRGEIVEIWVERDGTQTTAPPNDSSVLFDSTLVALFTWSAPVLLYCLPAALIAHRIRSRRMEQWEIDWARLHAGF